MKTGRHAVCLLLPIFFLYCAAPAEQSQAQATATLEAPVQTPDPSALAIARVIELVKHSHALKYVNYDLPRGVTSLGGGDPTKTDTEHAIASELRHLKGDLYITGWEASRFDDQHYVVTYCWTLDKDPRCFPFEVNTVGDLVRYIGDDPTLLKKYGFSQ